MSVGVFIDGTLMTSYADSGYTFPSGSYDTYSWTRT